HLAALPPFLHDALPISLKPALADDLKSWNRYNAACSAALAGCGQGNDVSGLDEKALARLRQQAMVWLRADLAAWEKQPPANHKEDRKSTRLNSSHDQIS